MTRARKTRPVAAESVVRPQTKVSRQDWIAAATRALVRDGVSRVKILTLAEELGVSRSSFYWYFENRDELLARLLDYWSEKNTDPIVRHAESPTATITEAVLMVYRCWGDDQLFDPGLEFAVRDWARRDEAVRERLDDADDRRLVALAAMFARHGFEEAEAMVRARVMYHSQLGYYALDPDESMAERLRLSSAYVRAHTGRDASPEELAALRKYIENL